MPEAPLTNPVVLDANAKMYADLLQVPAEGHVLWHPAPVGGRGAAVGDCGYIAGGRFIRLYNVFDDNPLGIAPSQHSLDRADIELVLHENRHGVLASAEIESIQLGIDVLSGPIVVPPPGLQLTLSSAAQIESKKIAFLEFYGPQRTVSHFDKLVLLEDYLVAHATSIISHYGRQYPVSCGNLAIVHRTTTSASWLGAIASSRSTHLGGRFSISRIGGRAIAPPCGASLRGAPPAPRFRAPTRRSTAIASRPASPTLQACPEGSQMTTFVG